MTEEDENYIPAHEEVSLDECLHRVHGYIVRRFDTHEWLDDLVQEAQVQAWKDYLDRDKSMKFICVRARYRVLSIISESQKGKWLGQPQRDRHYEEAKGKETREKIREFIKSYERIHNHQPSVPEIAKHMGMSRIAIHDHLRRLWTFSGPDKFVLTPLDVKFSDGSGDDHDLSDHIKFGVSFEDALISKMDTYNLMNECLTPRQKQWFYHYVFEGKSQREIGNMYGYSFNAVGYELKKARAALKEKETLSA